ncbi:hypothetical protein F5B22DRAFT_423214 [Xylaria bambusicola]|uniref:uncharacterized protein n=1 Tax=Xylaria bambusicola TaxID=326684 RepID=UPI00200855B0|nr:uncharacterized protein F5B22DRAFT_423214 [Xylaria bambusicola]KAI0523934.1 hypothetical protein F5B22DRAFT_423214 [Xylaria bambusicola]
MDTLAIVAFIVGTVNLQARYYNSAAFDRPLHFSVVTLVVAGLVSLVFAKSLRLRHPETRPRRHVLNLPALTTNLASRDNLKSCLRSISRPNSFAFLVALIVARTLLNWRAVRTIQCSWDGLYALLPFFLSICEHLTPIRPVDLPRHGTASDSHDGIQSRAPVARYAALALLWAFAVTHLSFLVEIPTGVICPPGWTIESFAPLAQLTAVFVDAVIISQVARLRQTNQEEAGDAWQSLGALAWTSAAFISFFAAWSCLDPVNHATNVALTPLEIRDIVIDSAFMALTMAFGVYLLGSFHAHMVALMATGTTVFVLVLYTASDSNLNAIWSDWFITSVVVFVGFGAMLHFRRASMSLHWEHASTLGRYCTYALAAFLLVLFYASSRKHGNPIVSPKHAMIVGRTESDHWFANAAKSTSFESATKEYRHRYGIPPPPNFDKWYEFAATVKSPVIDAFDQIDSDLLPFWAISPALLRQRATYLLEHPSLSMGGLIVQNGEISISPHIHGTHRWMMDVVEEMVKPFSKWLPDMQLAFNLDDECRVPVPAVDYSNFRGEAQISRSRAQSNRNFISFSKTQSPPWDESFLGAGDSIWQQQAESFHVLSKKPILSELVAPTCPADAPVNQVRWWNRKMHCEECASPHMSHGFVRNWTLAADICHQPDLAHLHGFLTSPSAMAASQTLFPVFSQAKVHGFADIVYPSPWGFHDKAPYEEERDIPWDQKLNSIFWRGASSDGFAVYGSWQMFLRARFVWLASAIRDNMAGQHNKHRFFRRQQSSSSADPALTTSGPTSQTSQHGNMGNEQIQVNVSYVGDFGRCEGRDCGIEHATFYGSSSAKSPPAVDFQENWHHRHLIDLDGAGFSGRFLPFLRSASLPYRAALFRTWWEERIHPWKHYVPLDLRLRDLWPAMQYFGASDEGKRDARDIAEAGQQWAKIALRKEDMQVYMFRLLLEWGRLVDDERERLGFVVSEGKKGVGN